MKNVAQNMLIALFGLITSTGTAIVLVAIDNLTGISLYSFMLWFLLPAGAIFSGLFAASGYLIGARLFHRRPTKLLLATILVVSTLTFFLLYYLKYRTSTDIIGERASDFISFWQYFNLYMTHVSISPCFHFRCASQGLSLGWLGYGIGLLQVVGFSMGGIGAYASLRAALYCEHCNRYYALKGTLERYYSDFGAAAKDHTVIATLLQHKQYQEAIDQQALMGADKQSVYPVKSVLKLHCCQHCLRHHIRLSIYREEKNNWSERKDTVLQTDTPPYCNVHVQKLS